MSSQLIHNHLNINGIKMHTVETGKGPLLVLLHGFPQFWYSWRHQIEVLSSYFHVIALDLRGYGESDKPASISDYAPDILMNDVEALIKAKGYENAYIVGHDWGGAIAWNLAINKPEIIKKVAVLNCPHPLIFAKNLRSNLKQLKKSWYLFFFQIPFIPEWIFNLKGESLMNKLLKDSTINKDTFSDEDINLYIEEIKKPGAFQAALNYYRAAFKYPLKNQKKKIQIPSLLIWGENDAVFDISLTKGMDSFFEQPLKINYIPACSHWVQEEQPEIVNQLLLDFLLNS